MAYEGYRNNTTEKLNLSWKIAVAGSFVLYYSGIIFLYNFVRKNVFKKQRRIILTYHRVHEGALDLEMSVSPKHFREQMSYLVHRYRVVSLERVIDPINRNSQVDLAAVTFDDGYWDNFQYAFPILKEKKIPAIIFLIADRVGRTDLGMLTLDQIKVMQGQGISFGSHTCTHPVLADIPPAQVEEELRRSREVLEQALGCRVKCFAYPKGKKDQYSGLVKDLVKASGYKCAVTMENGAVEDPLDMFEVHRLGIRDVPLFVFKVRLSGIFESSVVLMIRRLLGAT